MTSRKKPGVAFWATVAFSLPVLYVLSFGPVCWAISRAPQWSGLWGSHAPARRQQHESILSRLGDAGNEAGDARHHEHRSETSVRRLRCRDRHIDEESGV